MGSLIGQRFCCDFKGNTMSIAKRALLIQRTLGTRYAAGYLRNRKVSLSLARKVLTGKMGALQ